MKYIYSGPPSGATLTDEKREVMLIPGAMVDLPPNDFVATLVARGHLTPCPAPAPAPRGKSSVKGN